MSMYTISCLNITHNSTSKVPCLCDTYRLDNETDVDTICVTVEDYYQDFLHLRVTHCHRLMQMIHEQIIVSYLRQLLSPSR